MYPMNLIRSRENILSLADLMPALCASIVEQMLIMMSGCAIPFRETQWLCLHECTAFYLRKLQMFIRYPYSVLSSVWWSPISTQFVQSFFKTQCFRHWMKQFTFQEACPNFIHSLRPMWMVVSCYKCKSEISRLLLLRSRWSRHTFYCS